MKFVEEYRAPERIQKVAEELGRLVTRPWTVMEVCGGQTHAIVKYGIDQMLPPEVTLIHGPGCPVCVTSTALIDQALEIARQPDVIFCSFGDMLRVPGSETDLLALKAQGSDVRIVYSPLDCLKLAESHPEQTVVFFGVGFETTAPATAMAVYQAKARGLKNFCLLAAHVLVPPALEALLSAPENRVQGFLAAGHVCTVMGYQDYHPIAEKYQVPIVVAGFEPLDILQGLYACLAQLERGESFCDNQYRRSVQPQGNPQAQALIREVFTPVDREWRGLGVIPQSGWALAPEYKPWCALERFETPRRRSWSV
jgi:hydrogenase expression/formation protein HypD